MKLYTEAIAEGKDDPSVSWEAHEGLGAIAVRRRQPAEAARQFEAAVHVVEKTRSDLLAHGIQAALPDATDQAVRGVRGYPGRAKAVRPRAGGGRFEPCAGAGGALWLDRRAPPGAGRISRARPPDQFRTARVFVGPGWLARLGRERARDPSRRTAACFANRAAGSRLSGRDRAPAGRSAPHSHPRGRASVPDADRARARVDSGGIARHPHAGRAAAWAQFRIAPSSRGHSALSDSGCDSDAGAIARAARGKAAPTRTPRIVCCCWATR